MTDKICTACGRKSSEHILCSYDKVTRYCPGDKIMSKDEELELIEDLINMFDELGLTIETFKELGLIDNNYQPLEIKGDR